MNKNELKNMLEDASLYPRVLVSNFLELFNNRILQQKKLFITFQKLFSICQQLFNNFLAIAYFLAKRFFSTFYHSLALFSNILAIAYFQQKNFLAIFSIFQHFSNFLAKNFLSFSSPFYQLFSNRTFKQFLVLFSNFLVIAYFLAVFSKVFH